MTEDEQIATIVSNAKDAPTQIGVFVDDHKVKRFVRKIRAGLPAADFKVEVLPSPVKGLAVKTIIIKRRVERDPASN